MQKKKYVCISRNFLVISVCNYGRTFCSPCRSVRDSQLVLQHPGRRQFTRIYSSCSVIVLKRRIKAVWCCSTERFALHISAVTWVILYFNIYIYIYIYTVHLLLFSLQPTYAQLISQKYIHICLYNLYSYMFRHFHIITSEFHTCALLSYIVMLLSDCIYSHKYTLLAQEIIMSNRFYCKQD